MRPVLRVLPRMALWAAVSLVCAPMARAGAADEAQASPISGADSERRLRETGWTIDKVDLSGAEVPGVRHLVVSGRYSLPAESVWRAITSQSETEWPGINEAVVESQDSDTMIARYKIAVPVFKDRRYRLRVVTDHDRMLMRFRQVPGYGNVRAIEGSWEAIRISDTVTRVDYILDTDPGVRLVPGFIINWATRRMVPDIYRHVHDNAARHAARIAQKTG